MPANRFGEIAESYFFESSSGNKTYNTLRYVDSSITCDCPGWTRRVDAKGERSCKHTRTVEAGLGPQDAVRFQTYTSVRNANARSAARKSVPAQPVTRPKRTVEPAPAVPARSRFRQDAPEADAPIDLERFKDL